MDEIDKAAFLKDLKATSPILIGSMCFEEMEEEEWGIKFNTDKVRIRNLEFYVSLLLIWKNGRETKLGGC